MSGHTPGPWKVRDYRTGKGSIWIDCDAWKGKSRGGKKPVAGTIGEVYATGTGSSDPAVQEANARLVAASPKLLAAALGVLAEHRENCSERFQQLRSAVEDATGAWPRFDTKRTPPPAEPDPLEPGFLWRTMEALAQDYCHQGGDQTRHAFQESSMLLRRIRKLRGETL